MTKAGLFLLFLLLSLPSAVRAQTRFDSNRVYHDDGEDLSELEATLNELERAPVRSDIPLILQSIQNHHRLGESGQAAEIMLMIYLSVYFERFGSPDTNPPPQVIVHALREFVKTFPKALNVFKPRKRVRLVIPKGILIDEASLRTMQKILPYEMELWQEEKRPSSTNIRDRGIWPCLVINPALRFEDFHWVRFWVDDGRPMGFEGPRFPLSAVFEVLPDQVITLGLK